MGSNPIIYSLSGVTLKLNMSIKTASDRWSDTYDNDRNLTRDLDRTVTQKILTDLNLKFKLALELDCGTGKNTILLSNYEQFAYRSF